MKVLVAIDESDFSVEIANFMRRHAWDKNTEVKVVHAIAPINLDYPTVPFAVQLESVAHELETSGKQLLGKFVEQIKPLGLQVSSSIESGEPGPTIVEVAKDWAADLLIVGSHGRHGLERFLLGSVSSHVVSHAPCSVMVVRLPRKVSKQESPRYSAAKS